MNTTIRQFLGAGLLPITLVHHASAEEGSAGKKNSFSEDPRDPSALMTDIEERREKKKSLFPVSPLKGIHDLTDSGKASLFEATNLKAGLTLNHLFQGVSHVNPGLDKYGTTTDADFILDWGLINPGGANPGRLVFHVEGRWDYGTTGPQAIGLGNLGSQIGTANAFSAYTPTFLIRNLYWEQGGPEAGWAVRFGKITPDAMLATSRHITPVTTFLSNGGTGFFSNAYPDSGVGIAGLWFFNDDFKMMGLISDSNADRFNFGAPGKGDFYKALEFQWRLWAKTDKAGFSKLTMWHSDGTDDGSGINGSTGEDGWGWTLKLEQELTDSGRAIGVVRWGSSYDSSAIYTNQAGAHFLLYDPFSNGCLGNDLWGLGVNWAEPSVNGSRSEWSIETFYRFPLFPGLDTTISYQSIIDPALSPQIDHASVVSLRFRTVF